MFGVIAPYMVLAVPIPGARLKFFTLRRWLAQLAGYFKNCQRRRLAQLAGYFKNHQVGRSSI